MGYSSIQGNAKRLRIYIGDSDQWRGKPLYAVLLEQLKKEGLAGGTVFRGIAGFGAHSTIHTAAILDLSTDLPLVIEVVDTAEKIQHALETVSVMVREGLVTLEDVDVVTYTHRYLHPLPADRPVGEVMTRNVLAIREDQTALEAWEQMLAQNIKALPVVNSEGVVVGLLAHDDFLERVGLNARLAVAQRLDEATLLSEVDILKQTDLRVGQVMSQPAITVHPDDPLGLAAERLVTRGITRLPVVDAGGKLLGMLSRLDVLRQVMDVLEKSHASAAPASGGRVAAEVMQREVPVVTEDTDLAGVIASFLSSGEHRVIVIDALGKPVGLISDSDVVGRISPPQRKGILGALRGHSRPPEVSLTAGELMSEGAETIPGDLPVTAAIRQMVTTSHKWLVVVDVEGKPVGLVDREIALEALIR